MKWNRYQKVAESLAVKHSIPLDEEEKNELIKKYVDKIKVMKKLSTKNGEEIKHQFRVELETKFQNVK